MSHRAMTWARSVRNCSLMQKAVLLILADTARDDDDTAWPSVGNIAADLGCCDRAVRYALDELEMNGLISGERRLGRATRWTLLIANPGGRTKTNGHAKPAPTPASDADPHPGTRCLPTPAPDAYTPAPGADRTLINPNSTVRVPPTPQGGTGGNRLFPFFKRMWDAYPRQEQQAGAWRAFQRAVLRDGIDPEDIAGGAEASVMLELFNPNARMNPLAARWIAGGGYNDCLELPPHLQAEIAAADARAAAAEAVH